jgi:hypothetical protein
VRIQKMCYWLALRAILLKEGSDVICDGRSAKGTGQLQKCDSSLMMEKMQMGCCSCRRVVKTW